MRAKEDELRAGRDADALAIARPPDHRLSDVRQLEQLTAPPVSRPAREPRSDDHPSGRRRSRR